MVLIRKVRKGFFRTEFDCIDIPLVEKHFYWNRARKVLSVDATKIVKDYFTRMERGDSLGLMLIGIDSSLVSRIAHILAKEFGDFKVESRILVAKPNGKLITSASIHPSNMWMEVVGGMTRDDVFCLVYDRGHDNLGCVVLEFEQGAQIIPSYPKLS